MADILSLCTATISALREIILGACIYLVSYRQICIKLIRLATCVGCMIEHSMNTFRFLPFRLEQTVLTPEAHFNFLLHQPDRLYGGSCSRCLRTCYADCINYSS